MNAFVTSAAKKGRKEVFERQMSLDERRKFDPAKQKEIKNYVVNDVLEKLEPHEKPPRESILRMRWVLEYRLDENENKSPKARIVILGYLDLDYENRPGASPTMTRNTRQLLLQFGAWMGFSAAKGDVSGAFLQGRNLQRDLWVPQLAAALDVAPGEIMKLKKAAYGLVEASVEWYISISTVLKEHGWRRLKSDPCCWILIDPSLVKAETEKKVTTRSECPVVAATGGHVDDFVFVGKEGNDVWETAKKLQDHYRWKMWEYDNFLQCGVRVEHQRDGSFLLSQNEFVDELREIQITSQRRKEKGQLIDTTRTNRTERTPGWFGLEMRTDRSTIQRSDRTSTFQNRASYCTRHDRSQETPSTSKEGKWTGHTNLQFSYRGTINTDH